MPAWRFAFWIARRYFLSRRLPGPVNILTWVALFGLVVITATFVIVLSVFNGFNTLITQQYAMVDPDFRVEPVKGKFLPRDAALLEQINALAEVEGAYYTTEARVVAQYKQNQHLVLAKGVPRAYAEYAQIGQLVNYGKFQLETQFDRPTGVAGTGVAQSLGIYLMDVDNPFQLYALPQDKALEDLREEDIRVQNVFASGLFSLQKEYDDKLLFLKDSVARELVGLHEQASALEIHLPDGVAPADGRRAIEALLPENTQLLDRAQQHASLYNVMKNEKAVGYLVLVFMLLLTSVNIVGSLTMIGNAKRADLAFLRSAGALQGQIRNLFLWIGLLLSGSASLIGLGLGAGFVWLQENYHLLKLKGGENFIIDYFPMTLEAFDLLVVGVSVLMLALAAAWYPARRAARGDITQLLREQQH